MNEGRDESRGPFRLFVAEGIDGIEAGGATGGHEAEEDADGGGEDEGEDVDFRIKEEGGTDDFCKGDAQAVGKEDAGDSTDAGEGDGLDEKLEQDLARTGTFVARIDDEVFRNMSREQLEGVAERAWKRANATEELPGIAPPELRLRISTTDQAAMRRAIEMRLQEYTKQWRVGTIAHDDGVTVVEYHVQLRKKTTPDELLTLVRTAGSSTVTNVELS